MAEKRHSQAAWTTWEDMPFEEFQQRAQQFEALQKHLLAQVEELFPGLVTLSEEQRLGMPRLWDGEHTAALTVLRAARLRPGLVEDLADADFGEDPKTFEVGLVEERIRKHELLGRLVEASNATSTLFNDTMLYLASRFRSTVLEVYRLAKPHARLNVALGTELAPALDFYGKFAKAGAVTKATAKSKKDDSTT